MTIFTNRLDAVEFARDTSVHEPNWNIKIAHVKVVDVKQNADVDAPWWLGRDLAKTNYLVITEGTEGYIVIFDTLCKGIGDLKFMQKHLGVQLMELFSVKVTTCSPKE